MGIKDFKKVFGNQGYLSLKQLKGLTLAIDTMGELYRGLLGTSKVDQLTDKDGNPTNYVGVLIGVIKKFYTSDIQQIWVFDNPVPHPLKLVLADRSEKRKKAEDTLNEMNGDVKMNQEDDHLITPIVDVDIDDNPLFRIPQGYIDMPMDDKKRNQLGKQAFRITSDMINNVKRILDGFDIPYIIAPPGVEAEHVAAYLTTIGKADAVFTNDPDALLFGATRVIMRNRERKIKQTKQTEFIDYHLSIILEENKITREDMAKVAVALGCDFYSDKPDPADDDDGRPYFKGIGAKTILKKLGTLKRGNKFNDPLVIRAMNVYFEPVPSFTIVNEKSLANKKGARPFHSSSKISRLVTWLVDELGFDAKKLVTQFRTTFELEKIKYKKSKEQKRVHPNDPFVGKTLNYVEE